MRKFKWRYLPIISLLLYGISVPATAAAYTQIEIEIILETLNALNAPGDSIVLSKVTRVETVVPGPTVQGLENAIVLQVRGTVGAVNNNDAGYQNVNVGDTVNLAFLVDTAVGDRAHANHCRQAARRTFDNPNKSHFAVSGEPFPDAERSLLLYHLNAWVCKIIEPLAP